MDKTPREVVYDVMLKQNFQDAILDECEEISAAVIAHVTPQIEAKLANNMQHFADTVIEKLHQQIRAAAIEDAITAVCNNTTLPISVCMAVRNSMRSIIAIPPGHVCVQVNCTDELDAAIANGKMNYEGAYMHLCSMLAAAKEPK